MLFKIPHLVLGGLTLGAFIVIIKHMFITAQVSVLDS